MQLWLSSMMVVGPSWGRPSSLRRVLKPMASLAASFALTISASAVELVTRRWRIELQLMREKLKKEREARERFWAERRAKENEVTQTHLSYGGSGGDSLVAAWA